jgi:hypothetical protein
MSKRFTWDDGPNGVTEVEPAREVSFKVETQTTARTYSHVNHVEVAELYPSHYNCHSGDTGLAVFRGQMSLGLGHRKHPPIRCLSVHYHHNLL